MPTRTKTERERDRECVRRRGHMPTSGCASEKQRDRPRNSSARRTIARCRQRHRHRQRLCRARQFVLDAQQLAWPPMLLWHVQQATILCLLRPPHSSHSAPATTSSSAATHTNTHTVTHTPRRFRCHRNFVSKNGQNSLLGWGGVRGAEGEEKKEATHHLWIEIQLPILTPSNWRRRQVTSKFKRQPPCFRYCLD